MERARNTAIVFAGGLGLASYHAGAIEALYERRQVIDWVAGASAGAITAALVAGNRPEHVVDRLRAFWNLTAEARPVDHPLAHLHAWASVARSRVLGNPGHFYPRLPSISGFKSLYDLAEMRQRLSELIDFDYLNKSNVRLSIAVTDLQTGDPVIFDNASDTIGMDHLLASCGFIPEFAPVAIDGRVYADGGLSTNAPFEPVLEADGPIELYVIDLFPRDGELPTSIERAAERKTDLIFSNQTFLRLKTHRELRTLKKPYYRDVDRIIYLSYRSGPSEPGSEKSFNFSFNGLASRWREGMLDMAHALETPSEEPFRVIRRAG